MNTVLTNAVLTQRKYRLAGRLATDSARTFGLWWIGAFIATVIASAVYRETTGEYQEFTYWLIIAIPVVMTALAWVHLCKSYPPALANGITRREVLAAYAMFGAAAVLVTAVLTQLGLLVLDRFSTFGGVEHHTGFYGMTPLESVVRPALYFALGAAAGAAMLRFRGRWTGAAVAGLLVGAVLYRPIAARFLLGRIGSGQEGGVVFSTSDVHVPMDLGLAALLALTAWALLAKAPMRPKPA